MNKLERILVINTELRGLEAALQKTEILEHFTAAEIEVAQVVWDPIEEEEDLDEGDRAQLISAALAAERAGLHDLMRPHRDKVAWSEERVIWNKRADEAIIGEVKSQNVDLLIKPAEKHHLFDFLHAPLDWTIAREVDCPVLLSKSKSWSTGGSILAAIDTTGEHMQINKEIISTAVFFAEALQAKIHLITVAPKPRHPVSSIVVSDILSKRKSTLDSIVANSKLENMKTHVELGNPANVIAAKAEEINATVAILGTHSRTGVNRWVMGNTVEKALGIIGCDTISIRAPQA